MKIQKKKYFFLGGGGIRGCRVRGVRMDVNEDLKFL